MRVLAWTGLLLLVCLTGALEEAGSPEKSSHVAEETSFHKTEDPSISKIDETRSSPLIAFTTDSTKVLTPSISGDDAANKPEDFVTATSAKITENINNPSDNNDATSPEPWTPLSPTPAETTPSKTDANAATSEMYDTQTSTLATSNVTDDVLAPDGSDNNGMRAPTAGYGQHENKTEMPHREYKSSIGLYIILPVVIAVVVALIVIYALMMYLYRDRLCVKKSRKDKQVESEIVDDCDHELYSTVNVYTNFRHHGARAENKTLGQEQKLMTKMESEDECHQNNPLEFDDQLDSGRYVSPEGLVYATVAHDVGHENQKPAPKKREKTKKKKTEKYTPQYASLDFDKTGKLILKTEDTKLKKEKKTKKKTKL